MKYCKKCDIRVNSPVARCPLCFATLSAADSEPEPLSYPNLQFVERYNITLRVLLFLSLTVSVVCVTINFLTPHTIWWSFIVVLNIVYIWIAIGTALKKHTKIGFNILIQGLSLAGLLLALSFFFELKNNWVFNYALPLLFFSATLSITIIIIVRRVAIRDFILYFILTALMGFIPLVLYAVGLITLMWPAMVSAVYSALALASIFIFADTATKVELKKRLHI